MLRIAPGEIVVTDLRVIEPERAQWFGEQVLDAFMKKASGLGIFGDSLRSELTTVDSDKVPMDMIGLHGDVGECLDSITQNYRNLLKPNAVAFNRFRHWLHASADDSQLTWHTDTPSDVRFILNIGETDATIDIGTQWDPRLYKEGETDKPEPDAFERLTFAPAQVYVSNVLVVDTDVLRPHQIPVDPNRLVLRTSMYAHHGWRQAATETGVTIELDTNQPQ